MKPAILVYGYGNPGRIDDGLGPALAEAIAARRIPGVDTETAYQLQVEDATRIAAYDVVVFADAHRALAEPFELRPLEPRSEVAFSTHAVAPESVLALAHELFDSTVAGWILGIRGLEFDDYDERLSEGARAHLDAAAEQLAHVLRNDPTTLAAPALAVHDGDVP